MGAVALRRLFARLRRPDPEARPLQATEGDNATAISAAAAVECFNKLLSWKEAQCWNRLEGGCEYRADAAAIQLAQTDTLVMKAWLLPPLHESGRPNPPLVPKRQKASASTLISWEFHVAPAVLVRTDFGKTSFMIFDPSLLDGPCSIERWRWACSGTRGRLLLTCLNVFLVDPMTLTFGESPGDDVVVAKLAEQANKVPSEFPRLSPES